MIVLSQAVLAVVFVLMFFALVRALVIGRVEFYNSEELSASRKKGPWTYWLYFLFVFSTWAYIGWLLVRSLRLT